MWHFSFKVCAEVTKTSTDSHKHIKFLELDFDFPHSCGWTSSHYTNELYIHVTLLFPVSYRGPSNDVTSTLNCLLSLANTYENHSCQNEERSHAVEFLDAIQILNQNKYFSSPFVPAPWATKPLIPRVLMNPHGVGTTVRTSRTTQITSTGSESSATPVVWTSQLPYWNWITSFP